jgi:ABC-2 type transport system ATP-binding protein
MCDRVVIINRGKVAAVDTITDLSKKLSGKSKLLLSFKGPLKEVVNSLRTIPGITDIRSRMSEDSGIHEIEIMLDPSLGSDLRANIFYNMAKGGWPILEFRSLDPTLEEVFLNITSR